MSAADDRLPSPQFDLRAAIDVKDRLQGAEVAGRPADVHYSLPRESDLSRPCNRDKGQGTLLIVLQGAQRAPDLDELRRAFAPYGDIKDCELVHAAWPWVSMELRLTCCCFVLGSVLIHGPPRRLVRRVL